MSETITRETQNFASHHHVYGTSYFLFLKYNVFAIDQNLEQYVEEINKIKDLFVDRENGARHLQDAINLNKGETRYHTRTTNRIYTLSKKNFDDPRATDTDKQLIAMTFWLICKLRKVPSVLQFLMKGARGGRNFDYQFLENGGAYTCVDTAAITSALCTKMGINGQIKNDGIGSVMGFHHFFETDTGRIIDVPFGLLESGFFFDAADHPKTYKIVFAFFRTSTRRMVRKISIGRLSL